MILVQLQVTGGVLEAEDRARSELLQIKQV
jgi:hypothetical protein